MKIAAHLTILSLAFAAAGGAETNATAQHLKIGVVQMALARTLEENCTRIPARKQVRIEAENFRHLEGFAVEDRKDKTASHQLNIKLSDGTKGRLRTVFDEPFTKAQGRYNVVIRHSDDKGVRCRFTLFVNGVAQGSSWETSDDGSGWADHLIDKLEIKRGDELRIDVEGPSCRVDYVQLNSVE